MNDDDNTYSSPRRRYSTRVFTLTAAFVWVATLVIVGVFYYRETVFRAESVNADMQEQSAAMLDALQRGVKPEDVATSVTIANAEMRVTVLDTLGHVIYDTGGVAPGTDHSDRREVKMAMSGAQGYTLSRPSTAPSGGRYFYSARADGGNYIVRASLPYTSSLEAKLQGETTYVVVALLMSLILTVIAFSAARRMGRDVEQVIGDNEQRLRSEAAERDAMKARLTSNINHELKNPVHALACCLETLDERGGELSEEQRLHLCRSARQEVKRIEALIADIGTLNRLGEAEQTPVEKTPVDVSYAVADVVSHTASDGLIRIHNELPPSLPIVANAELLQSVFRNLIDNALLHSAGRDVWIRLVKQDADHYVFSVADNGIGIPAAHRDRVFERFYRVDDGRSRSRGGTGLGLAIVKNALAVHGGRVEARPRTGGGTEIIFTINTH